MRKVTIFIVVCFIFVISGAMVFAEMPGADAASLWNYITKESPYTQWSFWADHEGMQPGRAPHGPLHKVYVNDRALNSPGTPVEYGSIQVKESYGKDKKLQNITVMYKVRGYNPDDGDWFWALYGLNGRVKKEGKPAGCVGCHGARADNDFIFVHGFK